MCCKTESHGCGCHHSCGCHHGRGGHHGDSCGGGAPSHYRPRFKTKEQRIAMLEEYLDGLREEVKAVEEHIAELKE